MPDKHHHPLNVRGEPRAFFGRRSGKRLHSGQEALYREVLPRLEIGLDERQLDPRTLFARHERIVLEIGYGGGEHLARLARSEPASGFIGCEVFSGGIAKLLQAIDEQKLENVRLFTDDALKLLGKLPDASIDGVFLLYPDPWPKTRHHKRRFVSPTTLDVLARVLKPEASFHFATDTHRALARIPFRSLGPGKLASRLSAMGFDTLRGEGACRRPQPQLLFHLHAAMRPILAVGAKPANLAFQLPNRSPACRRA
jgi:tRNA (guanine-N7-)-methyltransferase